MFLKRLMDHLLNQVLVEGLANSKTFQRFAVWSNKAIKELGEKSKEQSQHLDKHVSSMSDVIKERSTQFRKEFEAEFRKLQEQQQRQQQQGKK